jgi:hypothetical protein
MQTARVTLDTTIESSWADIDAVTQSIRAAAVAEDWLSVTEMAIARHQQIIEHFQHYPVGPQSAPFYQHHLSEMLKSEKDLQALALDARTRVMRDGISLHHNRRALGAYGGAR